MSTRQVQGSDLLMNYSDFLMNHLNGSTSSWNQLRPHRHYASAETMGLSLIHI